MGLSSSNMKQQRVLELSVTTANGAQTGNVTAINYRREGLGDAAVAVTFTAPAAALTQNIEMGDAFPEGVTLIRMLYTIGA